MLVEFSITPMEVDHMSQDVAKVIDTLEKTGLNYHLGPMSTAVEGSWEEVMAAIQQCHKAVARGHNRVITTVIIDERRHDEHHLAEMISSVERKLGHPTRH